MSLDNVRVFGADGTIRRAAIRLSGGRIESVVSSGAGGADAGGLLALPGIVDLHGDAFERQLMPRPGVHFDAVTALIDTDRQLAANGITTAYHGLTLSWEPGLRGIGAAREFLAALDRARPNLACDTRLHLRFELYNLDCLDEVLGWIADGRVDLVAFNEHTRDIGRMIAGDKVLTYLGRTGMGHADFVALFNRVIGRAGEVPAATERLAKAAVARRIPLASHDDNSPEERRMYRELGCRLCEFPIDAATAQVGIDHGDAIILGAPNVLRGGSHARRIGAAEAAAAGLCNVLTSDYYYPSLLLAPFQLAREGRLPLPRAWDLVARNPARAVGLDDRGEIAPGQRADLVLIDDRDPARPALAATIIGGVPVLLDARLAPGLARLAPARVDA
jgi:alpha-D-ribose 1-methylphosphonate 5-triphosphate diphosphatase